jgi:hypothetical protein
MRCLQVALLVLSLAGTAMASLTGNTPDTVKPPGTGIPSGPNPGIRITGDTIADPFILAGPGTVTGTTVGFFHDYDEACPYDGSQAPDVVYAYTADGSVFSLTLDLCHSSYDTKMFVYDNSWTPGIPYACNDDFYSGPPCYTYSSKIEMMPVLAGHIYYIVVDGYGSQSGAYQLDVTDGGTPPATGACCALSGACTLTTQAMCPAGSLWQGENTSCDPNPCSQPWPWCPAGALIEGEPPCVNGNPVDNYNGGCNSNPNIFQTIDPQAAGCATMCGKSCASASHRDTDWYVSVGTGGVMTATTVAEFPLFCALMYGTDCHNLNYVVGVGDPGVPVTLSYTIADGAEAYNFVSVNTWSLCDESDYILDVCGIENPPPPPGACCEASGACMVTTPEECAFGSGTFQGDPICTPTTCQPVPTERKSWGALKNLYR